MSYPWFVAKRYLRAKGRGQFRALITALAVGGVAVGVAAAIIVLGVMNGFSKEVRGRIVGTNAHLVLLDPAEEGIANVDAVRAQVEAVPGIVATAPFVFGKILMTSDMDSEGAILRGVDQELERRVTDVVARIDPPDASFDAQPQLAGPDLPGIVLGKDLGAKLRVGIGEQVVATIPEVRRRGIPRMRTFAVAGFFESGIYEYDSALALTSVPAAQEALNMDDRVTGILARVDDMDRAPEIGVAVMDAITEPALWANDWIRQNRQLFMWMKIEKLIGYLIFAIILTVAAFLIASTLIMIVLEKTREIGVLMSLGADRHGIRSVFLLEGMAIGGFGTAVGCLTGWLACLGLDRYRLPLPGDIYFIETLPVDLWWGDLVLVSSLALVICVLSALYPSWRASRLVPVEAIRYE
ncbi:MAG: ABC transporter permease [Gemmatimonadota bacterium]|nr:MAG: ABC transporter permease [Gemmatimonadota bacterium]